MFKKIAFILLIIPGIYSPFFAKTARADIAKIAVHKTWSTGTGVVAEADNGQVDGTAQGSAEIGTQQRYQSWDFGLAEYGGAILVIEDIPYEAQYITVRIRGYMVSHEHGGPDYDDVYLTCATSTNGEPNCEAWSYDTTEPTTTVFNTSPTELTFTSPIVANDWLVSFAMDGNSGLGNGNMESNDYFIVTELWIEVDYQAQY